MTGQNASVAQSHRARRTMIRGLAVVLAAALGLVAAPAWADPQIDEVTVEVSPTQVEVGDTVTVTVSATGVVDLYAYLAELEFDPAVLAYVEDSATTDITGYHESSVPTAGLVQFVHTKMGTSPAESGDVVLLTATFEAIGAGETGISVEIEATDADGASVALDAVTATDTVVVTAVPGGGDDDDSDGDGGAAGDGDDGATTPVGTGGSLPFTGAEATGMLLVLALLALLFGAAIVIGQRRRASEG